MIPAGLEPVDAAGVARIRGVTLQSLRNSGLLKSPDFPRALNAHRKRDLVWDPAEVEAHRGGLAIPPRAQPSPDDLLDDFEAAAVIGISVETFTDQIERRGLVPQQIAAHSLRYWRRGDLSQRHAAAPGKAGKPKGASDLVPRKKRGGPAPMAAKADERAAALAAYLAQMDGARAGRPDVGDLAARYGVGARTIQRWLVRIDDAGGGSTT